MAKMKIYEIARSLQEKMPDLQSKDVVSFLKDNGFEVKGIQSSIEDDAIGFLLKNYSKITLKKHSEKKASDESKNEDVKKKKTEEKKSSKEKTEEKKADKDTSEKKETIEKKEVSENKEVSEKKEALENKKASEKEQDAVKEEKKEQPAVEEKKKTQTEKKAVNETTSDNEATEEKRDTMNQNGQKKENNKQNNNKGANQGERNQNGSSRNNDNRNGGQNGRSQNGYNNRNGENRGGYNNNRNGENRNGNGRNQGGYNNNRNGENRNGNGRNQGSYNNNRNGENRNGNGRNQGGYNNNRNGNGGGYGRSSAPMPMDSMKSEVKQSRQQRANKDARNSKQRYNKDYRSEDEILYGKNRPHKKKDPNRKGAFIKPEPVIKPAEPEDGIRTITLPEKMTIKELADTMKVPAATIIKNLFLRGEVVTLNHEITFEEAEEIALEYNCIAEEEEKIDLIAEILKEDEEDESLMKKRPPVVCVMGHVDHGKTSLLDAIRETHVTTREAGGITQHIGAYVTEINGEKITFLDTPGHEAFTSMRMRGAQSTDIAILVVAADDGVMPQTIEAINHAKAAGVEIIVAVNKIDKPSANIERVKQELVEHELIAEDWGGDTVFVPVSAHTKEGIDQLLEMIILTAEVMELKANPNRNARGVVIEAQLDKGRGPVATVLVQKGTLHVGDNIAVGAAYGKIRAMMDDHGRRVKEALPSTPVEILGLHDVPDAGEIFMATDTDKEARNIAETYIQTGREKLLDDTKSKLTLDGLFSQIQAGNIKELNIIVKADVQGSVEAVKQSLLKLSNDEVAVRVIHAGVGAINESDVSLASASNAIIIGFNVRPDNTAKEIADREKVDVRLYRVIYNAIEDIEAAMKGMLDPEYEEKVIGHVEVRQTFKASGVGVIAGSYVLDGKIVRGCKVRISREGEQIFEGDLASLKRFKDDVKEVAAGYECGLVFDGFNDVKVEDQVEAYIMVEVPRT